MKRGFWDFSYATVCAIALIGFLTVRSAGAATHLGVPVADLITLEMTAGAKNGCGESKLEFVRVYADGTTAPVPFRVPEGRALVVTELDWHYFNGAPGLVVILSVLVENLADSTVRHRAVESTVRLGADGVGGASHHLTSGFPVSSRARLCVDVINGPIGSPIRLSKVLLRGYLVNEN